MKPAAARWKNVAGHDEVLPRLISEIDGDRLSHAYLFFGPQGVGKHFVASIFATAINCVELRRGGDEAPCGVCHSCRAAFRRSHHDILFVGPEGNHITIDQIRDIRRLVQLKTEGAGKKVIIIDEASTMTIPAANSFLKILEEPPGQVVYILISTTLESLLPTIISRCRLIKFRPVSSVSVETHLSGCFDISADEAAFIARLSKGILADAVSLAADAALLERRSKALSSLIKLKNAPPSAVIELADGLIAYIRERKEKLKELQKEEFEQAEEVAVDQSHLIRIKKQLAIKHKRELARLERRSFNDILEYLNSYFRDALLIAAGGDSEFIVNIDVFDDLAVVGQNMTIAGGLRAFSHLREARDRLYANVSPSLTLEALFFKLREAF